MKTQITMDLGWGALVGGVPTTSVIGVNAMGFEPKHTILSQPYKLQDGSMSQVETATRITWKWRLYKGDYKDDAAFQTAIDYIAKWWQIRPMWVRANTPRWQHLHSTDWVQIVPASPDLTFAKSSRLFALQNEIIEAAPFDMRTL